MDAFFKFAPSGTALTDEKIAAAYLGLTPKEQQIITDKSPQNPWELWGLSEKDNKIVNPLKKDETITGTWIEVLKRVALFLHRTDLSYRQLLELLDTKFINPDNKIVLASINANDPYTCDINNLKIENLDETALIKVARFLRLWRKLGWTMNELDKAIKALSVDQLNDLIKLYHVNRLHDQLKAPVIEMLSWWYAIDNVEHKHRKPRLKSYS
jgi:hypothetical protein